MEMGDRALVNAEVAPIPDLSALAWSGEVRPKSVVRWGRDRGGS